MARPARVPRPGRAALERVAELLAGPGPLPAGVALRVGVDETGLPLRGGVLPAPAPAADDRPGGLPDRAPDDGTSAPEGTHELVVRAQEGDAEAFGLLYDRYVGLVHRYVAYRVRDRQLAEDLTSETFLRALKRLSSYSWQGRDVGAWFVTIARNLVADHYKSGRYRLELTADDVAAAAAGSAALVQAGPEGTVLDALATRQLLAAVAALGPEQQECIVLRFLQGMSLAETALVMGKNEGAVKALQYRAVRALARRLPEDR